jgi:hypothetical protein
MEAVRASHGLPHIPVEPPTKKPPAGAKGCASTKIDALVNDDDGAVHSRILPYALLR